MLSQPFYDTLQTLGLRGIARDFERQRGQPAATDSGFDERFALLLDAERLERANYRYAQRLRWAKLPQQNAHLEDLDQRTPRVLQRAVPARRSTGRSAGDHGPCRGAAEGSARRLASPRYAEPALRHRACAYAETSPRISRSEGPAAGGVDGCDKPHLFSAYP